jgi:hypothetical protein
MACAIGDLKAIQRSGKGNVAGVLARLREQGTAGRMVGCAPVVHLCESAEDCLALERLGTAEGGVRAASGASMVAMLLDTCRTIQLHAEAVDKTARYFAGQEGRKAFRLSLGTDSGARWPQGA